MKKTIGSAVNQTINCTQQIYPEPNLLFGGETSDNLYFDATAYIKSFEEFKDKSVEDFFDKFSFIINSFCESYEIPLDKMVLVNTDGHQLLAGCLSFIFIGYMDISFLSYMNDRINDLCGYGFAVSDNYLKYQLETRSLNNTKAAEDVDDKNT